MCLWAIFPKNKASASPKMAKRSQQRGNLVPEYGTLPGTGTRPDPWPDLERKVAKRRWSICLRDPTDRARGTLRDSPAWSICREIQRAELVGRRRARFLVLGNLAQRLL